MCRRVGIASASLIVNLDVRSLKLSQPLEKSDSLTGGRFFEVIRK